MSNQKVWVLTIDHRHGSNVSVFANDLLALAELAGYVREWWHDGGWPLDETAPEDDGEAINQYFENVGDEFYSLESTDLIGSKK